MTQFHTLTPRQAIEIVEAGGTADARKLIGDYAAAGLVKSYAKKQTTINARGERADVLGAAVAPAIWERMIRDGACDDAWDGGMVRLVGSDLVGGEPGMQITGLGFHPADIDTLAGPQQPKRAAPRKVNAPANFAPQLDVPALAPALIVRRPDAAAIPPGALLATVKQAEAALGFGRTKINELMNDGTLVRVKVGGATRIEVASIRAFAEVRN